MKDKTLRNPYFLLVISLIFLLITLVFIIKNRLNLNSSINSISNNSGNNVFLDINSEKTENTDNVSPLNFGFYKDCAFKEIGLSLKVPEDYSAMYEVLENLTTGKSYGFNLIIQNHDYTEETKDDYFQLYGIYQTDTEKAGLDDLKSVENELQDNTFKETTLGDIRVIEGLLKGDRPRYIYYFLHNERIFKFALSNPSETNRMIAEGIIRSLRFDNAN